MADGTGAVRWELAHVAGTGGVKWDQGSAHEDARAGSLGFITCLASADGRVYAGGVTGLVWEMTPYSRRSAQGARSR